MEVLDLAIFNIISLQLAHVGIDFLKKKLKFGLVAEFLVSSKELLIYLVDFLNGELPRADSAG